MKTPTRFFNLVRATATALLLTFGVSSFANGATLFTENWAGLQAGDTAASSGRWKMINGAPTQLYVVSNPIPSIQGNALAPSHGTVSPNKAFPEMHSTEAFSLAEGGLSITFDIALTNIPTLGYLRLGFVSEVDPNQAYWLLLQPNFVALQKRTAVDANSIATIKQHYFVAGEMVLNEVNSFTLEVIPISSTEHQVNMLFNGNVISSSIESGTIPEFAGDLRILYAIRDSQGAYLQGITVNTIPEGRTALLLLPVGAGLILLSRKSVRDSALLR